MSYPQKSFYSPDRIHENTQMMKSIFISPIKKQYNATSFSNLKLPLKFPQCFFHSKPIKFICISENCQCKYYTLCQEQQCQSMHYHPNLNIIQLTQFQSFIQKNLKSVNLIKQKINIYQKQVIQMIVHKLSKDFQIVRNIIDTYYIHKATKKISQGRFDLIKPKQLNQFINKAFLIESSKLIQGNQNNGSKGVQSNFVDSKNLIVMTIQKLNDSIKKLTQSQQYKTLTLQQVVIQTANIQNGNSPTKSLIKKQTFQSKIIQFQQQYNTIVKMLKENRINNYQQFKLLYRGSQHQFSAQAYHNQIDNKSPLLILILAETGMKFGAYIHCKSIKNNEWISDATGLSFIFSLDHNQTYRLKTAAEFRIKTLFGGDNNGPQIGLGCDIYISDKCNVNTLSGSNFGGSFQLPFGMEFNSKKAKCYLAGKENFQVQEYQVFNLI